MNKSSRSKLEIGSIADIAFSAVVLTTYFLIFSTIENVSTERIAGLIVLGIAYIFNGIYGFSFCQRKGQINFDQLYFFSQLLLVFLIISLGNVHQLGPLLLLPLTAHSVILLNGWWLYFINTSLIFVFVSAARIQNGSWEDIVSSVIYLTAGQIFVLVFTRMAVDEANNRLKVEALVKDLEAANRQLIEYASQIEELAITKERNRMAREIHDGLGHYLTTIYMQLQAAQALIKINSGDVSKILASAETLAQDALTDVRSSVTDLRETSEGIVSINFRLQKIVESLRETGIEFHLDTKGTPFQLSSQTEITLYRAAQEGINNSIRHGRSKNIWITLDYTTGDHVVLSIKDDGLGMGMIVPGFGLTGIRERVEMIGGKVLFQSKSGEGFFLMVKVPK